MVSDYLHIPSSGFHGHQIRLHPSILQCDWIEIRGQRYGFSTDNRHHLLRNINACDYLAAAFRFRARQRRTICCFPRTC